MKQNKFYLISGVLGLVVTTLIVSSLASAHGLNEQFFKGKNINSVDPARQQAREEAYQAREEYQTTIQTALDNGDYNAWREAIDSQPRISDIINQDNFDQFVQMHNYMQSGDFEAAGKIRTELGLPEGGHGMHNGFAMGHRFKASDLEE